MTAATAVSGGKAQDFPDLENAAYRKFCSPGVAERIPAYSERPHGSDEVASEVGVDSGSYRWRKRVGATRAHDPHSMVRICVKIPDRTRRRPDAGSDVVRD